MYNVVCVYILYIYASVFGRSTVMYELWCPISDAVPSERAAGRVKDAGARFGIACPGHGHMLAVSISDISSTATAHKKRPNYLFTFHRTFNKRCANRRCTNFHSDSTHAAPIIANYIVHLWHYEFYLGSYSIPLHWPRGPGEIQPIIL